MAKVSLLRNVFIYTVTDVLGKIFPFVLIPILSKNLTLVEYGVLANFQILVFLYGILFTFNSQSFILIKYIKGSVIDQKRVISFILFSIPFFFILWIGAFIIFDYFNGLKFIQIPFYLITILLLNMVFESISSTYLNIEIISEKAVNVSIFRIGRTILEFALTFYFVVNQSYALDGRVFSIVSSSVIFGSIALYKIRNSIIIFSKDIWLDLAKRIYDFSLPLIPHQLSHWLKQGYDRILITIVLGISTNAIYTMSFQLVSTILIVSVAINNAYSPHILKLFSKIDTSEKNYHNILKLTKLYVILISVSCIILYYLLPFIYKYFIDSKFYSGLFISRLLIIGIFFKAIYYSFVAFLLHLERTKILAIITFSSSILYLIISFPLLNYVGIEGVCFSLAICEFIAFVAVFYFALKYNKIPTRMFFSLKF